MQLRATISALSLVAVLLLLVKPACALAQEGISREERSPSRSLIEDFNAGLGAATSYVARAVKPLAPDLIMYFEGWEPSPYDDPSGYCTIGFGHLIKKAKCADTDVSKFPQQMQKSDGATLLESDTATARAAVQRLVTVDLADHEFGALVSFTFNVGKTNFAKSKLLKLLNEGYKEAAAKEFGRYIASNGKILNGLNTRRACETALFKHDLKGDGHGRFITSECGGLGAAPTSSGVIDIVTGETLPQLQGDR